MFSYWNIISVNVRYSCESDFFVPNDAGKNVLHGSVLYWIDGDNSQVIQSDIGSDGMRYRTDRNRGDDPTDGSVVLDPIASYSKIR